MCEMNYHDFWENKNELLKFEFQVLSHRVEILRVPKGFRPIQFLKEI